MLPWNVVIMEGNTCWYGGRKILGDAVFCCSLRAHTWDWTTAGRLLFKNILCPKMSNISSVYSAKVLVLEYLPHKTEKLGRKAGCEKCCLKLKILELDFSMRLINTDIS